MSFGDKKIKKSKFYINKKAFKIYGIDNNKILSSIKFYSELVYGDNDKYLKIKIKIYDNNVNTSFQGKKVRKENASISVCH